MNIIVVGGGLDPRLIFTKKLYSNNYNSSENFEKTWGDPLPDQHLHRLHHRQLPHNKDHSKRLGDCSQVSNRKSLFFKFSLNSFDCLHATQIYTTWLFTEHCSALKIIPGSCQTPSYLTTLPWFLDPLASFELVTSHNSVTTSWMWCQLHWTHFK